MSGFNLRPDSKRCVEKGALKSKRQAFRQRTAKIRAVSALRRTASVSSCSVSTNCEILLAIK